MLIPSITDGVVKNADGQQYTPCLRYGKFASTLCKQGYDTTPLNGKRPILKGWTDCPDAAKDFTKYGDANIGIVCGGQHNIIAVDIDVLTEAVTATIKGLAEGILGAAPERIGKSPKTLLVYRCDVAMTKRKTAVYDIDGKDGCVEILAEGQQFVASGIHPETKLPYKWPDDNLLDYPADELPLVSADDLSEFLAAANTVLSDYGEIKAKTLFDGGANGNSKFDFATSPQEAEHDRLLAALAYIPNGDSHYDDWAWMAHAIKGACGDGVPALDLFHRWSGRSSKYDEAQTDRMWRSIGKVNKIGAGSIFHLAMQNGYEMVNDLAPDDMPANSSEIALGGSVAGTGMPALDMSVLTEGRRDPPVLSLDPFGPYCHYWLLSAAEDRGAPVDYVATGLLAITGALLGNVRWVSPWVGWKEPPIIWMAQVGHPSSGKSPGQDAVREPLTRLEEVIAEGYPDDLREYLTCKQEAKYRREDWEDDVKTSVGDGKPSPVLPENAIEPEKPPCPRIAIVDATPEAVAKLAAVQQRGLLSHRDELAGMIGGFDRYNSGGGERAFWLEAYGGRKYIVDRKKEDQPLIIPHLSISILGGLQPDRLASLLLSGDDDGLAARFLYTWPNPVEPNRPTGTVDDAVMQRVMTRLWDLPMAADENGTLCPRIIPLTAEAADTFQEWREEHHNGAVGGMIGGHYGKMPGMLLRLSLNLEFLWWASNPDLTTEPETVSLKAVGYAAHLIEDYFKPMAERCFGDAALPEAERLATTVARWIIKTRPELVNVRNLYRNERLPGLREPAKAKLAVNELVDAGWLVAEPSRSGGRSGQQKSDYRVNPEIWERLK